MTEAARRIRVTGPAGAARAGCRAAVVAPLLLTGLFLAPGCMEAAGTTGAESTTASGSETVTPAPLPGTASLPASFTGPPLVDPALYGQPLEGPIFSGLEPRPDIFEARATVRWRGQETLAGIWIAHPAAPPAIRARFINPDNGRGADGALIRRAGAERALISSEAAEALEIRSFRDVEVVIVAVDLPTVIAVGEPGDPETLTDAAVADGSDPLATPEIGDVVANARIESAADGEEEVEAAEEEAEIVLAQNTAEEPAFLSEAEDAIDDLQGPVVEADPAAERDNTTNWQRSADAAEPGAAEAADDLEQNRVIKIDGPAAPIEAPDTAPVVTQTQPVETPEAEPAPAPDAEPEPAPSNAAATAEPQPEPGPVPAPDPEPAVQAAESDAAAEPERAETPAPQPVEEGPAEASAEPALARPFVQAGVFSVEGNARRVITTLRTAGHGGRISNVTLQSGPAFRVVAGPFTSRADRQDAIRVLRNLGIADAAPTRR
ncbi:MAG: SPOR domain-containing protein [Pseudomonadota bacterium]